MPGSPTKGAPKLVRSSAGSHRRSQRRHHDAQTRRTVPFLETRAAHQDGNGTTDSLDEVLDLPEDVLTWNQLYSPGTHLSDTAPNLISPRALDVLRGSVVAVPFKADEKQ